MKLAKSGLGRREFIATGCVFLAGAAGAGEEVKMGKVEVMKKPYGQMELMHPDELEAVIKAVPVAYVPLGTFEHHGWHLPVCFDGIKAHELCMRAAEHTGGMVLPAFYYGTGGGHKDYKWSIIADEAEIRPLIARTLDKLAAFGFKVVILLTGHYPGEQKDMVRALAQEAEERNPGVQYFGLPEPDLNTPAEGDSFPGDHASKYETSIGMALCPEWVRMDLLTEGRDTAEHTLKNQPTGKGHRSVQDALFAQMGADPRKFASKELGERLLKEIIDGLDRKISEALART